MNKIKEILNELKKFNCVGIKISFEDEGALINEVQTMRYLTSSLLIDLYLKIGGCESKRDIVNANEINCDGIVAPMIESHFALDKFIKSCEETNFKNKKGINIETELGFKNIYNMKENIKKLDFVTLGRVDYVGSIDKDRNYVDSESMLDIATELFKQIKLFDKTCCLGGAISINSKKFIQNLVEAKLLDKFETRYIIFETKNMDFNNFELILYLANLFEVEWMKFINNRYSSYANKDKKRILMIEERLENNSNFKKMMIDKFFS